MDSIDIRRHQQIEFFLLLHHVVNELHLLRNVRRVTPASGQFTINQMTAIVGKLFRSFLMRVFPRPAFSVKHKAYLKFIVDISNIEVRNQLHLVRDVLPEMYQSLQPHVDEMELLRFDFPTRLTIYIGKQIQRGRWAYHKGVEPQEIGIGRHCPAVLAVLAWKKRLDEALKSAANLETELEGPPAPLTNRAQEQLEAVLRAAAEAGTL